MPIPRIDRERTNGFDPGKDWRFASATCWSADLDAPVALKTQPFAKAGGLSKASASEKSNENFKPKAGTFSILVPDVRAAGIARDPERAVRKALRKICRSAVERGVNMLEIASLQVDSSFGFSPGDSNDKTASHPRESLSFPDS